MRHGEHRADQPRRIAFGRAVSLYDQSRPRYLDEAVDWALPRNARRVLDLGAGTGKLTLSLIERNLDVVAIDPSASMLIQVIRSLPGVSVVQAAAEKIPVAAATIDTVTVGAAFHWFERPAADAEIARVLRPSGAIALLWNPVDPAHPLYEPFAHARAVLGLLEPEFDASTELDRRWFTPTERAQFAHSDKMPVDRFAEQFQSRSYVISAPEPLRADLIRHAYRTARAHAAGDQVEVGYLTTALRATRR
jgi:ubiquinone/menaquinone biosynthesis C-methylase UbiE